VSISSTMLNPADKVLNWAPTIFCVLASLGLGELHSNSTRGQTSFRER